MERLLIEADGHMGDRAHFVSGWNAILGEAFKFYESSASAFTSLAKADKDKVESAARPHESHFHLRG